MPTLSVLNVMITNYSHLFPIFGEKIGAFLGVMIQFLHTLSVFYVKNDKFYAETFRKS
jgi:hypothetical protein